MNFGQNILVTFGLWNIIENMSAVPIFTHRTVADKKIINSTIQLIVNVFLHRLPLNARRYDISVLDKIKPSPWNAVLDVQLQGSTKSSLIMQQGARPTVPKSHIAQLDRSNEKELVKKLEKSKEVHVNGKKKVLMVKLRAAQQGHVNVRPVKESAVIRKKAKKLVKNSGKLASKDNINDERKVRVRKTNKQDRVNVRPPKKTTGTNDKPKNPTKKRKMRRLKKRGRNPKRTSLIRVILILQFDAYFLK